MPPLCKIEMLAFFFFFEKLPVHLEIHLSKVWSVRALFSPSQSIRKNTLLSHTRKEVQCITSCGQKSRSLPFHKHRIQRKRAINTYETQSASNSRNMFWFFKHLLQNDT